ncbi:MAG: glutathione peroxidase [Bacteroidetes bacterium]|nr:MAG: glutathione peroxidase [Bacteroidota bacterium]
MTLFDFQINDINGRPFDWNQVKGKKILLLNTASECGFTRQYAKLEELYRKYENKGFSIIAFPCNDFGAQEPGDGEKISAFCHDKYDISFPIMEKIAILGEQGHPLFQWLYAETGAEVSWNFQKYLINENGKVDRMLPSQTEPDDPAIIEWIQAN